MTRHIICALAGACSILACSAPLAAQDRVALNISYRDINLASPHGVATLNGRVNSAVAAACGADEDRELSRKMLVARCRREMQASASPQVAAAISEARQFADRRGAARIASR